MRINPPTPFLILVAAIVAVDQFSPLVAFAVPWLPWVGAGLIIPGIGISVAGKSRFQRVGTDVYTFEEPGERIPHYASEGDRGLESLTIATGPGPGLAERPVEDPLRIGPPGLVLYLAADGEHPAQLRTGLEASRDEVAPTYRGTWGDEAGQGRARSLQEHRPFPELATRRGRGGASELVGRGHSREESKIGSRCFQATRQSSIGSRSGLVSYEPGGCEVVSHERADLVDQPLRRPQPAEETSRRFDPGPVVAGRAELFGNERLAEIVAENREHERFVVLAAAAKIRCPVEGQHGMAPYVAFGMPARILGHADERLDLREESHEARLAEKVEADGGAYPEEQVFAKLREHALRCQLGEVEPAGKSQQLRVGLQLEAGGELCRSKSPQGVFREVRGIRDAKPLRGEVLPAPVRIEDFAGERIVAN